MDNELIVAKSWWQRKRYWFIVLTIITITAIVIFISNSNGLSSFTRAYADLPLYEKAIEQARDNEEVAEALGTIEPIGKLTIAEGNVNYVGDSLSATIMVKGTKAKAKLDIAALKVDGSWSYKLIKIRVKEPKQEIVVLEEK